MPVANYGYMQWGLKLLSEGLVCVFGHTTILRIFITKGTYPEQKTTERKAPPALCKAAVITN